MLTGVTPEAVAAFVALLNHTDTLTHDIHLSRLFFNSPGSGANPVLFGAEERRAIATPLTFIWGEADPFGGGDIAREFVQPFSDATLHLLAGAGHVPWFDEPDRLPELVRGALTI